MQRFINVLELCELESNITLLDDNKSSIRLVQNAEQHSYTKHIDVQHHYIQSLVDNRELIVEWVAIKNMLVNGLTKALTKDLFKEHQQ